MKPYNDPDEETLPEGQVPDGEPFDQEVANDDDELSADADVSDPDDGHDPWEGLETVTARPGDTVGREKLRGMFQNWFLDYASYVILDRSVPAIEDGLKPVQRRILHSMQTLDDGRYNKVANIVGNTMQYHPHGDASIYDALVKLGQKELLVDTQGNWGNTLTGASAAAGRYIEARLSQFALDVLYNAKVTEWTPSYDGRKKEPVALPVKFPLLLSQGVEGIAVGLSSKIMPHNFNELIDAAISHLKGEPFELYPDFPTGGFIDVSRYNDGRRGGAIKIRAKIEKVDNKTLAITEIPFGTTTGSLIASIVKASESGKIKIRKVDDNTAATANITVSLLPGTSSDKTIDALYAFTDCELKESPNCCVIADRKPRFMGVSDVLRVSTERTREILKRELEIQLDETREQLFFATLEKIFIQLERIYKDKEYESAPSREAALLHIEKRLEPWAPKLLRPVRPDDDLPRLLEIRMGRIIRYNAEAADRQIAKLEERIKELQHHLAHLTDYTIAWFEGLKHKYGSEERERRTVIRSFDSIEAAKVAEANEKLYFNKAEGFIGTGLKKDELVGSCSSMDDVIVFYRDGRYKIVRVAEKLFVGKGVIHVGIYRKGDTRMVYNLIYQNGKGGPCYMKRCAITGVTRDREYNLTPGKPGTLVRYFTANPNGEAEIVRVVLKPKPRLAKLQLDVDFGKMAVKGKGTMGNLVTKNEVHHISQKEQGVSTLGGLKVWFDPDVLRLNTDGRGECLGEFQGTDKVLVVLKNGEWYTSTFDTTNHYEDNILRIEKWRPGHVWTAIVADADQGGYPYLKRFTFEATAKRQRFIGENAASTLLALSDEPGARFALTFTGADADREPLEVVAADFVGVKSAKAKGKRLTTWALAKVDELEPAEGVEVADIESDEPDPEADTAPEAVAEPEKSDDEVRDELTGQQRIF